MGPGRRLLSRHALALRTTKSRRALHHRTCPSLSSGGSSLVKEMPSDRTFVCDGLLSVGFQEARGYYTISVHHRSFVEGAIKPGEAREGCVSFGCALL